MPDELSAREPHAPPCADARASGNRHVLLVVPPFRSVVRPALGVSVLKAALMARGHEVSVLYLNLMLADRIGAALHETLGTMPTVSLGNYGFACVLFEHSPAARKRYITEILEGTPAGRAMLEMLPFRDPQDGLRRLVTQLRQFANDAVRRIVGYDNAIVGFTSSYEENTAAWLLCRDVKAQRPRTITVMGGANCQGEMGHALLEHIPELDYVAQGECDLTFPDAVDALRAGHRADGIPGMLSRQSPGAPDEPWITREALEQLPVPDFDDYFAELNRTRLRRLVCPGLPLETARGCWWGAKGRCRFCGLNGELAFRGKSADRVLEEVDTLVARYGIRSFNVVDNMLNMRHVRELFPRLAERRNVRFFWETPGRLSATQIEVMAGAGVTHIQAGLESLSDRALELMHKPTRRLHNIQTLRWCNEAGIVVYWNHLAGVPGDDGRDIDRVVRDTAWLSHLGPPSGVHMIRLQRFSRYFERPAPYGFADVRPVSALTHVYPLDTAQVHRLAYHFESDADQARAATPAFRTLQQAIRTWRRAHATSLLLSIPMPGATLVVDTRPARKHRLHWITGTAREILKATTRIQTMAQLATALNRTEDDTALNTARTTLEARGLLLSGAEGCLALPIRCSRRFLRGQLARLRPMPGGHLRWRRGRKLLGRLRRRFTGTPSAAVPEPIATPPATHSILPSVSVILATSNRATVLARALASLQAVDYPADKLEIVVVDDGSTDETPEVIRTYAERLGPVSLVTRRLPKGNIAHARQCGVDAAKGDILVFTDDDCTFEPDWLRVLVEPFAATDVGAVGGADRVPPNAAPLPAAVDYAFSGMLGVGGIRRGGAGRRAARYMPRGCNLAVRRQLAIEVGGFDPRFFNGEEIDLGYRMIAAGYRLVYQDSSAVWHDRRATWRGLARQVIGRGRSRHMLFRKHPARFEPAYAAPAAALGGLVLLLILAPFAAWAAGLLTLACGGYGALLLAGGLHAWASGRGAGAAVRVPGVLAVTHMGFAAGYAWDVLAGPSLRPRDPRALRCLISNDGVGPNVGDRAILEVMRRELQAAFPDGAVREFLNAWAPGPGDLLRFARDLRWADILLLGGGQVVHDQTCLLFLAAGLLKLAAARLAGVPYACYGIGVGPLHSRVGRRAVRALLARAEFVRVRDEPSRELLAAIGVPEAKVRVTADLAFRLPPLPEAEVQRLVAAHNLGEAPTPRVAICPRRWFHYDHGLLPVRWRRRRGTPRGQAAMDALEATLAAVADAVLAQGGTVILLPMKHSPHAHDPGQDDDAVCRAIRDRTADPERVRVVDYEASPSRVAALLGTMDAVVTLRMHAAILAALSGVPAVGLALSDKFTDCFTRLGQANHLVPVEQADGAAVLARLETVLREGPEARQVRRARAATLAQQAGDNMAALHDWIRDRTGAAEESNP